MTRVYVHIDRLAVPHAGFDVAAFTRALQAQVEAQYAAGHSPAPATSGTSQIDKISAGRVTSTDASALGSAVGRSVMEGFR